MADKENFAHGWNRKHLFTKQLNQFASQHIVKLLLSLFSEPTESILRQAFKFVHGASLILPQSHFFHYYFLKLLF